MPRRKLQTNLKHNAKKINKTKNYVFLGLVLVAIIGLAFLGLIVAIAGFQEGVVQNNIAVIQVKGEISLENGASSEALIKLIEKANSDFSVKAIILEINSPGGTVLASKEVAEAVKKVEKPTVALIREIAASGAYWIASSADVVVADASSITGSIGVTSSYLQFENLFDKYGITYERLVTGEYKDTGTPYKQLTSRERSLMLDKLQIINDQFISSISANRNMTYKEVAKLATGEIFLGSEAFENGLIDVLGNVETAQAEANALAHIKTSSLVAYEYKPSFFNRLGNKVQSWAYHFGLGIGSSLKPTVEDKFVIEAVYP